MAATKYTISDRSREAWATGAYWSDHALKRWDERTPTGSVAPETAWRYGLGLPADLQPHFTDREGLEPDEVKLYDCGEETRKRVLLVRRGPAVVTVLEMSFVDEAWLRGAIIAHEHAHGAGGADR